MAWEIKHIFDGDYGCEELQPGEKAKVSVTLVNEKGETKVLSVEDQWLLDKNLSEGSIWPEQTAFIKYHLSFRPTWIMCISPPTIRSTVRSTTRTSCRPCP